MLARHLLFIATRRPQNSLYISSEPVSLHAVVQPPPYVPPPKPDEKSSDQKSKEILKDSKRSQKILEAEKEKQIYESQAAYLQDLYGHDPRTNFYDNNQKFFERNRAPDYNDYQRRCEQQVVQMQNAKNQQYYPAAKDVNQQFYTLPSRRPAREVEPPRSVTPDITRGLGRGSLSAMHMLARHGQKPIIEQSGKTGQFGSQIDLSNKSLESLDAKNSRMHQQRPVVDVRNRFATPLSLSALGYRFFASSPVHDPVTKSPNTDALKHNPISPIGHGYGNGFKSSTPTGRNMPTVAERLALSAGSNCSSPVPNSSGRSTPVQTSSGRSTPTNLVLSPTKSTMSNEELFAAIHKSKKRLNIKDDSENMSPYGSMNSLVKVPVTTTETCTQKPQRPQEVQNVQSPSATSRLDFKRLLLQQSVKTGPTRLSAAEQLKLSRQQCQQQPQQSLAVTPQVPLTKVLSPRSAWRFQTPRTDVLSSTIIEDTAAEEKAMKPSPENTSPISRLNTRRQLDLCSDLPEYLCPTNLESKISSVPENRVLQENRNASTPVHTETTINIQNQGSNITNNRLIDTIRTSTPNQSPTTKAQNNANVTPAMQYLPSMAHLTPECQGAISAFESRRISNQLARAQFLASTPVTSSNQGNAAFKKRFRARSESPQHNTAKNVTRSPSAPTLETAL